MKKNFSGHLDVAAGQLVRAGSLLLRLLLGGIPGSQATADLDADAEPVEARRPIEDLEDVVHVDVAAAVPLVGEDGRQAVAVSARDSVLQEKSR